jgi:hypothetical protein
MLSKEKKKKKKSKEGREREKEGGKKDRTLNRHVYPGELRKMFI